MSNEAIETTRWEFSFPHGKATPISQSPLSFALLLTD